MDDMNSRRPTCRYFATVRVLVVERRDVTDGRLGEGRRRRVFWGSALQNNMHIQVEKILEINRRFSEQVGIEALRPEAKILFTLKTKGSLSVKEAMILSGLSYRGFYIVLARLANSGWITMEADLKDRRVKRILLADQSFGDYPLRVNVLPPAAG
ncbi:hypothetical protein [Sphingomonas colocasiae]|uniref:MarR family transcriptional regulator n=1 Tax=Sphingomonas colocasiae TaxID=1848973 RepID=A0ABS7PT34_9SPHN|nr:hypothetical protein [Sphingomonas colocasiae]MBY8824500.1 hypothetical protein [Sphingomonas colocasiae]